MAERWFPVLAAVLGLLGGIGGAAVGGYVANKGQGQRFEEERAARIRDVRPCVLSLSMGEACAVLAARVRRLLPF